MFTYEDLSLTFLGSNEQVLTLLTQYRDGHITKEDFAKQYDNLIQMIYGERE